MQAYRVRHARCVLSFLDTKVVRRAGGVDDKVSVSVGSPRYIRETTLLDATRGDDVVDPVIRWLLSSAEDIAEQAEGDRDGTSRAPSVRV